MVLDASQVQDGYIWVENTLIITTVRPRKLDCSVIPCSLPIIWKIVHLDFHTANGREEMCQFHTRQTLHANLHLSSHLLLFELAALFATCAVTIFSVIVGKLLERSAGVVDGLSFVALVSDSLCCGEDFRRLSCEMDTFMPDPSEVSKGPYFLAEAVPVLDSFTMASFVVDGCDTKKLFTVCLHCSTW